MRHIFPDLRQTAMETRFGTLQTHAYVLDHDLGRDLIYVAEDPQNLQAITETGGVDHIYLSHNHEISNGLFEARDVLSAKLVGHAQMKPRFPNGKSLDIALDFETSVTLPSGLEAIYTPGHTDNNICYRYASPHGKTYLFTGDTLYLDQGKWRTIVMQKDGGDPSVLRASLAAMRDLTVDVVITSVAVGENRIVAVDRTEWTNTIDHLMADLG